MLGKPVPDFSLPSTGGSGFQLSSQRGHRVVLISLASHPRFKEKTKFPFELLTDPQEKVCKRLGVIKLKNLYVPGHVEEVLNFVKSL